jgi:hypothetical protein
MNVDKLAVQVRGLLSRQDVEEEAYLLALVAESLGVADGGHVGTRSAPLGFSKRQSRW